MWYPRLLCLLLFIQLTSTSIFGESPQSDDSESRIENGIYLILRHTTTIENKSSLGENERVVARSHNGESHRDAVNNDLIVVPDKPALPLVLTGEPSLITEADGTQALMIELKGIESLKKLHNVSEKHLNQQVAIVINEEVVMTPKVRSVISDGKLKISVNKGNVQQLKRSLWPKP